MLKTLLAGAAAVALLAAAPAQAQDGSRLDKILTSGTLRVGTTGDYKPFTFKDPQTGEFSGFDIDEAKDLAKALGVKVEFVQTSWPNLMKDFEADKYDVAMGGISVTLERQKKAYFSQPYLREGKTPITLCKNKDKFETLAEIDKPGVKAIVNPGGTNEKFARAHLKNAEIVVFPDNTKIFDQIAEGKADLMMTDASETRFQQKQHPGELCAVHPDKPFDFAEKAYLLPRDMPLKLFVDEWLHTQKATGGYDAIMAKWLG